MGNIVVVGAQWGDEGKGKIIDFLAAMFHIIARAAGGANAGHTLVVNGEKIVCHLIPSGILHMNAECLLGAGMVIDGLTLLEEIKELRRHGVEITPDRLKISKAAHMVMPSHIIMDELREKTSAGVGSTKRGIADAYADKMLRVGIRAAEMQDPSQYALSVHKLLERHTAALLNFDPPFKIEDRHIADQKDMATKLAPYLVDSARYLATAQGLSKRVLGEGAQAILLDPDHGTYPMVTSSGTTAGSIMHYLGLELASIESVIGVTKAYTTRVGEGPFPTEFKDARGDLLREKGLEYGSTTKRPRRCGALDLVALNYAVQVGGITQLALTKLDILSGWDTIPVCTGYELDGERIEYFPAEDGIEVLGRCKPIYTELKGWQRNISAIRDRKNLPVAAQEYLTLIEQEVERPITLIGVGPEREQIIEC